MAVLAVEGYLFPILYIDEYFNHNLERYFPA
jgi:hypothetical protein